jgi:hypothetical protein
MDRIIREKLENTQLIEKVLGSFGTRWPVTLLTAPIEFLCKPDESSPYPQILFH